MEGADLEVLRVTTVVLSKSKNIALLIGLRDSHPYEPINEFIYGFNFNVEFKKKE
ncbi:MAG: hypothetical protein H0X50_08820 [Nitrosopumilus sp.]|nr:hypothetical protein [Nitrosopumilus sp.]